MKTDTPRRTEAAVKSDARLKLFFILRKAWKKRSQEGMKAKDLAELLERDKAQVSRILNGSTKTMTMDTLALLLDRLDHQLIIDCKPAEDIAKSNFDARLSKDANKILIMPPEGNSATNVKVEW
jgi:transcriptional regulator with XRE-family HTH domain